ncbi:hypothetical protein SKAU_G00025440 [Synaphobranchus kaupii]|uniref:HAT C-terminal dimerisation domain-containing protein n=1 Tax=Synaphobranchus kaupii TaxID=118154 RepID=A0A9Q1GCL2_SYNKA|nr:hypothetical protein SKAU_G00025440 [Synaphobranchus kaupii]
MCMTTDSGANMVCALGINKWPRLACFGHRLHIAIERSVQNDNRVARATGVCKKVVSTFSYSWKKKKALTTAQRELNLPTHKLVTESPTRWGSRVKMMERMLEQEKAVTQVLAADQKSRHLIPTWQDIKVWEAITTALTPLQAFTDALSGEEYATYLSPEELEEVKNRAATEAKALEQKTATEASSTVGQSEMEESTAPSPQPKKTKISLASFFEECSSSAPSKQQGFGVELDSYLLIATADHRSDPLQWWHLHSSHFPRISRLAKQYLCILATSSPSERVFSKGGNIVTSSRASLKPENVNRLVFLAKNLNVA